MDKEITKVTVTRSFTYDVKDITDAIKELSGEDPKLDDVLEQINDFALEDLRSPISRHEVSWYDQDGQEID